ncbi:hypothetical protein PHLGIDRAFT_443054 [Phlebiopsis gigantea 11061_1 CR5-6]|uniref:Uncharacterized protein n=1 Tax=Phlebiopsis gigantea (strain 11061_1 CR5-6) TaxID=745531 RepID=A0A0C3PKN2_PHLG1|nr:hypothetical protein PHLGIDRAFT_443054 [Phlebiopsis gigantea 11061_1 CR5-6]
MGTAFQAMHTSVRVGSAGALLFTTASGPRGATSKSQPVLETGLLSAIMGPWIHRCMSERGLTRFAGNDCVCQSDQGVVLKCHGVPTTDRTSPQQRQHATGYTG